MSLWDRVLRRTDGGPRGARAEDAAHLSTWAGERVGVEGFVEPRTTVTEMTLVLVAKDGEWTRRRVAGPAAVRRLGRQLRIPVYDVQRLGYPQRMRDYESRRRVLRERARREELGR